MLCKSLPLLKKRNIIWSFLISWFVLILTFQTILGAGDGKTRTNTVTDYSTFTVTEIKEQTLIKTIVETITGPKIEETVYATYTTVTTKKVIYSITYRYTSSISITKDGGRRKTVYYYSEVREAVPVTVLTPRRVSTIATALVTLTESVETTFLTKYSLAYTTKTKLDTMTITRIYETEYVEEFEEEKPTQLITILKDYGIIIAAVIIVALAIIPKTFLRKKLSRRKTGRLQ